MGFICTISNMELLNYIEVEIVDSGGTGPIPKKGVVRIIRRSDDLMDKDFGSEKYKVTNRPLSDEEIRKIQDANKRKIQKNHN